MPNTSYQGEVEKLNGEIAQLKEQLQKQQLDSSQYKESIYEAQKYASQLPSPKDLNPILKQIRKKNLSMREKKDLLFPTLFPSLPEDIYYQWIAPTRLTVHRDRQWYWTMGLLLMIMLTIAVLFREMIWIAVILAFFFAVYVNSSIPAEDTVYRLTRQGIEIGDGDAIEIYSWDQLLEYSYYFKHNTEILYVDTILAVPQRLQILFSQEDRKNINMILEANVPYRIPPKKQSWISRLSEGVYIPLQDFKTLQEKIDQYYNSKYAEIIYQLKKEGKIPNETSIEDIRNVESINTMQIMGDIQRKQEEDAKRILGI
jgi:hypothetical protein